MNLDHGHIEIMTVVTFILRLLLVRYSYEFGKEDVMNCKLSAFKFIKNNKRKVGVMMVALSLTFMAMYVGGFLLFTTSESFKPVYLEQPKRVGYVDLRLDTMGIDPTLYSTNEQLQEIATKTREDIMEKLCKKEGITQVYFTQTLCAIYTSVVGQIGYDFPLLDQEQVPEYLEHMGARLIDGRMPENAGEILVDKVILNNRDMKIGGYFEEGIFGQVFKVVGVVESENLTCVGTPMGYTNTGWYMVVLCDEENSDMTKLLADIGISPTSNDTINDAVEWRRIYDREVVKTIDTAINLVLIVIMIFLAISITVAYVSFMRSRINEYCLYASIGYSKADIYKMIMREIGIIFGISIAIGGVVAIIFMLVLGHCLLDGLGLIYRYFYPKHLICIIAGFLAIVAVLQMPITVTLHNIKTIDRMEE